MKRSYKRIIALVLVAAALFAGCSRSGSNERRSSDSRSDAEEPAYTEAAARDVASYSMSAGAGDYETGFYTEELAADYVYTNDVASSVAAPGDSVGELSVADEDMERMLIRNVTVSCETLDFAELTSSIESQVAALGGYIESKNFNGTGNAHDLRTASYTIRVTSDALDQLVNTIGGSAIITSSNENTEDVTLTYADTQARIESLRTEQETLNNLLAQADDLDIILQLQNELTYVRYEIESYESQLRVLENLSSYSTLTLYINEVIEATEPEEPHVKTYSEKISDAFHDGLNSAKNSLEDLGLTLAENVISIAVIIVIGVAAFIIFKVAVKKGKKKLAEKKSSEVKAIEIPSDTNEKKD